MQDYPTYENTYSHDITVGDKTVHVEIGKFSEQVAAAVVTTCGETVVLTTVALGRKVDLGYFPLSVEFQEKLYAGGIIKGSRWVKRDGRPTDAAILKGRVIDRTLRPLFPDGVTNEVQVISTVFSYDEENDPDMLALLGAGIGLQISQIPFEGPVAGVRVGYSKETDSFMYNPTETERKTSDLDLIVSGNGDTIVMVEAGANEINEEVMLRALESAQKTLGEMAKDILKIAKEIGKEKVELVAAPEAAVTAALDTLKDSIYKKYKSEIWEIVQKEGKLQPSGADELLVKLEAEFGNAEDGEAVLKIDGRLLKNVLHDLQKKEARRMIIEEKKRPDGRKPDEIRQIWSEVDIFPRTHGSAMFKRGATQVVSITTLGSPSLGQYIEDMGGESVRNYMHFYNMPPFASGEAGRVGSPKRREVGHGALAERALMPMIPSQEEFPYTIQVVSEVVSSNGSTSQGSVCGSTLSLMAAGVPIKRPVAGIAMGLMSDEKGNYVVLSDIQGLEDHVGDMDFKVAGTTEGITAIQMDIKLTGLTRKILEEALEQALKGRLHIMEKMLSAIEKPRGTVSALAPKIEQVRIPIDRIGELIGPGGKVIKNIIALSGAEVDVNEDPAGEFGMVNITSSDQEAISKAKQMVENIMYVATPGDEFDGTVTRVESYGAFVEYVPGREGLVHVSEMSGEYVNDANDIVKLGDAVHVWVSGMKDDGKVSLSMLSPEQREQARANRPERPQGGGGDRGGFRGGDRGGRGGGFDRRGGGGDRGGYRGGGDRGGRRDR